LPLAWTAPASKPRPLTAKVCTREVMIGIILVSIL
jgi:hypothetical protein